MDGAEATTDESALSTEKANGLLLEVVVNLLLSLFVLVGVLDQVFDFLHHLGNCFFIDFIVLNDGLTEVLAYLLQHIGVKMQICILSKVRTTKTGL